jgi:hypothetical protein
MNPQGGQSVRVNPGRGALDLRFVPELPGRRRIRFVKKYRITHMTWNPVGDHYHPTDVTYVKPDGSQDSTAPDQLPFAIKGDVDVDGIGVVVRSGVCTKCGQRVMPSKR